MNIYQKFRDLHRAENPFILGNAWNAGSAVILQQAGFQAIGTTSAGIAFSHGLPDYQGRVSLETALEETAAIVQAVDLPVSMDGENGYADSAIDVHHNMQKIAQTGVAGVSIEDHPGGAEDSLYDLPLAIERVQAAREALDQADHPVTLTARAECFLVGQSNAFAESVERINRYYEAGADCLFVPGLKDIETIAVLVRSVTGPVNVVMGLSGPSISVSELGNAGVKRISIGGSLARATLGFVRQAAREMLDHGTFNYADQQIADSELCALFSTTDSVRGN